MVFREGKFPAMVEGRNVLLDFEVLGFLGELWTPGYFCPSTWCKAAIALRVASSSKVSQCSGRAASRVVAHTSQVVAGT